MANFRLILTPLDYTPTATSADSTYPVTNIEDYGHLLRPWKAAVATGIVNVTLDFGAGNTLSALAADPGIFLDDLNVTSLRIQGNSVTTDWETPPWDQAVTISQEPRTRRYNGYVLLSELNAAPFAYRYLNIRILSQTPTDALAYRISRAFVGATTELLTNPEYGITRKTFDPKMTLEFMDGGSEVSEMGERRYEFTVTRQVVGATELAQELAIQAITPGTNVVIWDSETGGSQSAWIMRRVEDPSLQETFLAVHGGSWSFREVI